MPRLVARQLDDTHLVIRTQFDERDALRRLFPATFSVPKRFVKHMMVAVDLARGDERAIEDALLAARERAAEAVRDAKEQAGLTWVAIAEEIGKPKEWTVAALLGQHPLTVADASAVGQLLGLMSAINFKIDVSRRADPAGDRVVVTFDGKFLDYQW